MNFFSNSTDSFFEQYSAIDHLPDEGLELFFHGRTLQNDASTYSLRGPAFNRVGGR